HKKSKILSQNLPPDSLEITQASPEPSTISQADNKKLIRIPHRHSLNVKTGEMGSIGNMKG
ncbi:MAG: hypothetical protein ACYTDW_13200, partial [Planctomycetota bacterium]